MAERSSGTVDRRSPRRRRAFGPERGVLVIAAFCALAYLVNERWPVPTWMLWVYAGASVIAFAAYAKDKVAASAGTWRVSETTLHLVAVVGGWPGAIVAQEFFRHKTMKESFRVGFWSTVVINVLAFLLITTPALTWLSALVPRA